MQGPFLRKYGVETTINFQLYETDGASFQTGAAHAAGDSKIMKDEGAEANTTNGFTDEGTGYSLVLSSTEMEAARIVVYVADQTSPAIWIDEAIVVETYGNASAMHAFDLDTATQDVNVAQISDDSDAADNLELFIENAKGTDHKALISTDAQDLSTTLDVNTKLIEGGDATDAINAACDSAIETYELDHLMSVACDGNVITGNVVDHSALACLAAVGNDISDYDASTDSLEALGTGLAAISAATIADAVWDEAMSGHVAAGSFGKGIADIPDSVWDEEMDANAPAACDTAREYMNVALSALAGKTAGTGDWSARDLGDTKTRLQGTLSTAGARSSVDTLDGT